MRSICEVNGLQISDLPFLIDNTQHSNGNVNHYLFFSIESVDASNLCIYITNAIFHVRAKGTPRIKFFNNFTAHNQAVLDINARMDREYAERVTAKLPLVAGCMVQHCPGHYEYEGLSPIGGDFFRCNVCGNNYINP